MCCVCTVCSDGFPGNHIWSATPTSYEGQHYETETDPNFWHHVKYIFPVPEIATDHIHGAGAISREHFMVESFDDHCDQTYFDNILITRATAEAFCSSIDPNSYETICPDTTEWHSAIDMSDYVALRKWRLALLLCMLQSPVHALFF